jgi:putative PIN family toxin of toxin-antitoxin system
VTTAVLDTNVLASGFAGFLIPVSKSGQILHHWRAGQFELLVSEHILTELANTFANPYFQKRLTAQQAAGTIALVRSEATITPITIAVQGVATHPEDDVVLATAVSGGADYLVTGDSKLQERGSYRGVIIISPAEFLEILNA